MYSRFDIRQHVEFDARSRAVCPLCQRDKGDNFSKRNLSVREDGAYYCHRCSQVYGSQFTEELRLALGVPMNKTIPAALAYSSPGEMVVAQSVAIQKTGVTVSDGQIQQDHDRLKQSNGKALDWLYRRGFTPQMVEHYQLGITRFKRGAEQKTFWGISIPIPAGDGGYYKKCRLAPWLTGDERLLKGSQPASYVEDWFQKGINKQVFFSWNPPGAVQTYLCEGEWDAMLLGWQMRSHPLGQKIAVASFTCGCSAVPDASELLKLPGEVIIFYDRNDEPNKVGARPGEEGAKKVAQALGDRALVALVPQKPEYSEVKGWDVSDAINAGFTVEDFTVAAQQATKAAAPVTALNPLMKDINTFGQLVDTAPEYQEWLVPGLLTSNELFMIAAGPRQGKSLIGLTLAHAVATGGNFLDRPVPQGKVIYINLEDSNIKIKERLIAQGWSREAMEEVYSLDTFQLSQLHYLDEIIQHLKPRLLILDTLSRIRDDRTSEDKSEMGKLLEPLQNLAKKNDCSVVVIHHTTKVTVENADTVDIFSTIRGSGAIRATARGTWILAPSPGGVGHRLYVEHGWGKEDIRIFLDEENLTWKPINPWNPQVDDAQRKRIWEYLQVVNQATVHQVSSDCQIAVRSVGTILSSLQKEGLLKVKENTGRGRIPALYLISEISIQLKQIESSLKHETIDMTGKTLKIDTNGVAGQGGQTGHPNQQNVQSVQNAYNSNIASKSSFIAPNTVHLSDSTVSSSFNPSQTPYTSSTSQNETNSALKVGSKCKVIRPNVYGVPSDKELNLIKIDGNIATVTYEGCRCAKGVEVDVCELVPVE